MIWLKIEIMSLTCTIASIWKIVLWELYRNIEDCFSYKCNDLPTIIMNVDQQDFSSKRKGTNSSNILQNVTNTLNGVIWRPAGQINQYHTYFSLNNFAEGQKIAIKRLDGIQRQWKVYFSCIILWFKLFLWGIKTYSSLSKLSPLWFTYWIYST